MLLFLYNFLVTRLTTRWRVLLRQYRVSFANILEHVLGSRALIFVRVVLQGELAISLFNFSFGGSTVNTKNFVRIHSALGARGWWCRVPAVTASTAIPPLLLLPITVAGRTRAGFASWAVGLPSLPIPLAVTIVASAIVCTLLLLVLLPAILILLAVAIAPSSVPGPVAP